MADEETTAALVAGIEAWQSAGYVHPLTCGKDSRHANLFPFISSGEVWLRCPDCDYTQRISGTPLADVVRNGPPPNPWERLHG